MLEWIDPRFGVTAAVLTLLIALSSVTRGVFVATAKARAARERLVATPGGRIRLYRTGIVNTAVLAVAALAVAGTDGVDLADLGLREPAAGGVALIVGVSLWLSLGVVVRQVRLARARRDGTSRGGSGEKVLARIRFLLPVTAGERWMAAGLAVCVGIGEEIVYRGLFIAAGVGPLGLDVWPAILLSSLLFGFVHLYQGWRGTVSATLLGLIFAMLYALTGTILVPIAIHAVFDVVALVVGPWLGTRVERRPRRAARRRAPAPVAEAGSEPTSPEPTSPEPGTMAVKLRSATPL